LANVVAISTKFSHSLALKADGTVVAWGFNQYDLSNGPTNVPTGLNNVVAIATGYAHSLALRANGTVVGWGENNCGQATPPAGLSNVVAISAGADHSLALKADGTVVVWGTGYPGDGATDIPAGLTNVISIDAGFSYSVFLTGTNGAPGGSLLSRAQIPARVLSLIENCDQNTVTQLGLAGTLKTVGGQLAGAKALISAILELGSPYTLARDGVLHGFLYGDESLVDADSAKYFLQAQVAQLKAAPNSAPQALADVGALRYLRFQDRFNSCLTNLQATGQPEIPTLVNQTLGLLNILCDAWTQPTNSPRPALQIGTAGHSPVLSLFGEPYQRYTLQYRDTLNAPGWNTTSVTNWQDEESILAPVSGGSQRYYRAVAPAP